MCANKNNDQDEILLLPYNVISSQPSKAFRQMIPKAFNLWLSLPEDRLCEVVEVATMMHDLSLIYDDIFDKATTRRGVPAAHQIFGEHWTMNAMLIGIAKTLTKCIELHPMAPQILSEQILKAASGQGREVYWRETLTCPSEEDYMNMLEQKTGEMFNFCLRLMQLFSDNKTDYSHLIKKIGLHFQLRDDYCNIVQPEKLEEFPDIVDPNMYYSDLTEGKFTLPIIHAAKSKRGLVVLNLLRHRPADVCRKKYCISLLEESGSLSYTSNIARLGGNPHLEKLLNKLKLKPL